MSAVRAFPVFREGQLGVRLDAGAIVDLSPAEAYALATRLRFAAKWANDELRAAQAHERTRVRLIQKGKNA